MNTRVRMKFVIQAYLRTPSIVEQMAFKDLEYMAAEDTTFISLLRKPLEYDEYYSILNAVDVLLLPYKKHVQEFDGNGDYSGIFLEALSANKLMIVSDGTRLATQSQAAVLVFEYESPASLARRIMDAADPELRAQYAVANAERSHRVTAEHAAATYLDRLQALCTVVDAPIV
jgi:glycosyltransferase involved in cell wall biosynthesis